MDVKVMVAKLSRVRWVVEQLGSLSGWTFHPHYMLAEFYTKTETSALSGGGRKGKANYSKWSGLLFCQTNSIQSSLQRILSVYIQQSRKDTCGPRTQFLSI